MKSIILANGSVGFTIVEWLLREFPSDVQAVCVLEENRISDLAKGYDIPHFITKNNDDLLIVKDSICTGAEYLLSLWWPFLLSSEVIKSFSNKIINTHPSLLPFGRGKNPNFWAIVEKAPFGVSLHVIDEGIDCGSVLFQKKIEVSWEDTGETLYNKALEEIVELFISNYPLIRAGDYELKEQDLNDGTFHMSKDMSRKVRLDLKEVVKVEDVLNLLRAKTFSGFSGCTFIDDGVEYEVSVSIKKVSHV